MNETIDQLILRYKQAGVMVDTNILLLYFIGAFDPNLIQRFKRTVQFTIEDHATLLRILRLFDKIVTTPNILTEVNSLSGQLHEPIKSQYFAKFSTGIALLEEEYVPSKDAARMRELIKFGLTDAGILHQAKGRFLVLTDDFRLSQYLQSVGVDVLNFNHIRVAGWRRSS